MMSKKSLTIIIAVIVLGIGGFYAYTSFFNNSSESKEEADTALSQKETLASSSDSSTADSTSSNANATKPSTNTSDGYSTPSSSDNITVSASQPSSSEVVVSTKLSGYSDGTCNLTIKNGSGTINKSAQVFYQPEFSTCAGFTIDKAELGSGTWAITLTVVSDGETVSKTTSLGVQ